MRPPRIGTSKSSSSFTHTQGHTYERTACSGESSPTVSTTSTSRAVRWRKPSSDDLVRFERGSTEYAGAGTFSKHVRRCFLDANAAAFPRSRAPASPLMQRPCSCMSLLACPMRDLLCYSTLALLLLWCAAMVGMSIRTGRTLPDILGEVELNWGLGRDVLAHAHQHARSYERSSARRAIVVPGHATGLRGLRAADFEVTHMATHHCTPAFRAADPPVVALCVVAHVRAQAHAGGTEGLIHTACEAAAAFTHVVVVDAEDVAEHPSLVARVLALGAARRVVLVDGHSCLRDSAVNALVRSATYSRVTWSAIRGGVPIHAMNVSIGVQDVTATFATALASGGPMSRPTALGVAHSRLHILPPLVIAPEALSFALHSSRAGGTAYVAMLLTEHPAYGWTTFARALMDAGIVLHLLVPPRAPWVEEEVLAVGGIVAQELFSFESDEEDGELVPAWKVARTVTRYDAVLCFMNCAVRYANAADVALAAGVPVVLASAAPRASRVVTADVANSTATAAEDRDWLSSSAELSDAIAQPARALALLQRWLLFDVHQSAQALVARVRFILRHRADTGLLLRTVRDDLEWRAQQAFEQLIEPQAPRLPERADLTVNSQAREIAELGCDRLLRRIARREHSGSNSSVAVAFYTYELSPINHGGAGVVIAAMAIDLVAKGHVAVVIGHMACNEVDAWHRYVRLYLGADTAAADRLHVHCVWNLVTMEELKRMLPAARMKNEIIRNSLAAAISMQRAYLLHEFDIAEVFDYNGVGSDILRARADMLHEIPTVSRSRVHSLVLDREPPSKILAHAAATWFRPFANEVWLPLHVPVVIRAHGTIQAIDESEQTVADQVERRACYAMEQFAAEASDAVLAQSNVMLNLYERVYNLPTEKLLFAPPPMQRILDMLARGAQLATSMCDTDVAKVPVPCDTRQPDKCVIVLVLGKLQLVKGPETVAAAFSQAMMALPGAAADALHLVYIGTDLPCPLHRRYMSECLQRIVPPHIFHRVKFAPGISRMCIPRVVAELRPTVGIMASEFETFNLVAHELAFLGVPLIVSDIPAYQEFFNNNNAYIFTSRNVSSLATQLVDVVLHATRNQTLRRARLEYADPIAPYHEIVRRSRQNCRSDAWVTPTSNTSALRGLPAASVRAALDRDLLRWDSKELCDVTHA